MTRIDISSIHRFTI